MDRLPRLPSIGVEFGWPALEERVIRYSDHLRDIGFGMETKPHPRTFFMLHLDGQKIPVMGLTTPDGDVCSVYPPFEASTRLPVTDIASFLLEDYSSVHIFTPVSPRDNRTLPRVSKRTLRTERIYQSLLPVEYYTHRLRRFSSTGFHVRPLSCDDYDPFCDVTERWVNAKARATLTALGVRLFSKQTLPLLKQLEFYSHEDYADSLSSAFLDEDQYNATVSSPHGSYVGTFLKDELLAYTSVYRFGDFVFLGSGARVPMPGKSPLEFLDLTLFAQFAREHVRLVDWGYNPDPFAASLLAYKNKFGITRVEPETHLFYERKF